MVLVAAARLRRSAGRRRPVAHSFAGQPDRLRPAAVPPGSAAAGEREFRARGVRRSSESPIGPDCRATGRRGSCRRQNRESRPARRRGRSRRVRRDRVRSTVLSSSILRSSAVPVVIVWRGYVLHVARSRSSPPRPSPPRSRLRRQNNPVVLKSPDGALEFRLRPLAVRLRPTRGGQLAYRVSLRGKPVFDWSKLGTGDPGRSAARRGDEDRFRRGRARTTEAGHRHSARRIRSAITTTPWSFEDSRNRAPRPPAGHRSPRL